MKLKRGFYVLGAFLSTLLARLLGDFFSIAAKLRTYSQKPSFDMVQTDILIKRVLLFALLAFLIIGVSSGGSFAQTTTLSTTSTIKVATWNIEGLELGSRGVKPNAVRDKLKNIVNTYGIEIIILVEATNEQREILA